MGRRWYVVRTKPQSDFIAARALEREGLESYFPRVEVPRPLGRGTVGPLFPGYLFLRCDLADQQQGWLPLSTLPGILGFVRFGGATPSVPDEVISDLARELDLLNSEGGLWPRFRRGETVRVVSDKMESLAEVLEEPKSPQARIRVLLEFMGRMVPAQVPVHSLRRVGESALAEERRRARRTRGRGRWIGGFRPQAAVGA